MSDDTPEEVERWLLNAKKHAPQFREDHLALLGQPARPEREFLFTYRFDGAEWGTSVFANSVAEAKEKIKAVALARYDGELVSRIPALVSGFGLLPRLIVWLANWSGVGRK